MDLVLVFGRFSLQKNTPNTHGRLVKPGRLLVEGRGRNGERSIGRAVTLKTLGSSGGRRSSTGGPGEEAQNFALLFSSHSFHWGSVVECCWCLKAVVEFGPLWNFGIQKEEEVRREKGLGVQDSSEEEMQGEDPERRKNGERRGALPSQNKERILLRRPSASRATGVRSSLPW